MTLDPSQQSNPRRISGGIKQILLGQQGPIQSSNQAMERVAALITIDHYFTILERIAWACHWPQREWGLYLIPLLTGKAWLAFITTKTKEEVGDVM